LTLAPAASAGVNADENDYFDSEVGDFGVRRINPEDSFYSAMSE
jgi:hypothetical protein